MKPVEDTFPHSKQITGGNGRPIYASKAFSCKEIYRIVLSEGLDVEVVCGGELYTALQAGVPASKIHFQGNNKSIGEIVYAVESGVGDIVVDHPSELMQIQRAAAENSTEMCIRDRIYTEQRNGIFSYYGKSNQLVGIEI